MRRYRPTGDYAPLNREWAEGMPWERTRGEHIHYYCLGCGWEEERPCRDATTFSPEPKQVGCGGTGIDLVGYGGTVVNGACRGCKHPECPARSASALVEGAREESDG